MSKSKELVVELRIPLPIGLFEEAATVAKVQYAVDAFKENIDREIGDGYTLAVNTTMKRGPKTSSNGAARPRQRKSEVSATAA